MFLRFRQTSGENFDVYLQNVKAQSEAFRSNRKRTAWLLGRIKQKANVHVLQLEESLVSFALVPLFSRTSIRHKHGDSQHGVQLGFHHKDALHQRGRDLSGFRVGGRGRWAFRDAFHQAKRNIFDFGDAPIGKSVSNQIRVGCCIPIRDRIFILVSLL